MTEAGDVMLSVMIKVNAPTAVGSSALLGDGVLFSNKHSQTPALSSDVRTLLSLDTAWAVHQSSPQSSSATNAKTESPETLSCNNNSPNLKPPPSGLTTKLSHSRGMRRGRSQ